MNAEPGGRHVIPQAVEEVIELQRSQLMHASTVLSCLWIASLYQEWHDVEIDAGSIALIVRRIIDDAVSALDSVELALAAEAPDVSIAPDLDEEPDDDMDDD